MQLKQLLSKQSFRGRDNNSYIVLLIEVNPSYLPATYKETSKEERNKDLQTNQCKNKYYNLSLRTDYYQETYRFRNNLLPTGQEQSIENKLVTYNLLNK